MRRNNSLLFGVITGMMIISGCSSPLSNNATEPTTYTLRAQVSPKTALNLQLQGTVLVKDVVLAPGLDSEDISIFVNQGRILDKYADVEWAAPLDELVHDVTVRNVQAMFPNVIVGSKLQRDADYSLEVNVLSFQPVYKGTGRDEIPVLVVELELTLLYNGELARLSVSQQGAPAVNTVTAVTTALETLLNTTINTGLQELFLSDKQS